MKTKLLSLLLFFAIAVGYSQVNSVALVGEAAGGWPGDPGNPGPTDLHQMTRVDADNWILVDVTLTNATAGGGVKFRANNSWDQPNPNWGSTAFPTGVGIVGGANIPCVGGTYTVTFNSTTGAYHFEGPPIPVVKLVGTAVSEAEGLTLTTSDAVNFTLTNATLLAGNAQFNIDVAGGSFGGSTFPEGDAQDAATMIPVPAGVYTSITFNLDNGHYVFTAAPVYPSIAIVGPGAGGWPSDPQVDANVLTTTDGETYRGTVTLTAWNGVEGSDTGNIKFRSNNDWNQPNWGGTTFPTGPNGTGNIVVNQAGTWDVEFTRSTGAYRFYFPQISLTGDAFGGWGDGFDFDLETTDGANYMIRNITAVATNGAKFRSNHSWDAINVTYGSTSFPSGLVSSPGDNIPVLAGDYSVTLNRVTKEFAFSPALATENFNSAAFKTYPNPTHNNWNFTSAKGAIESIQIVDVLGKTVLSTTPKATTAVVDASTLNTGVYFAKIATATGSKTVKVVKN